tara:strand:+ start:111 stop:926 length:816 start_codon:yes stop_codon:yes gene_type:complete
MDKYQNNKKIIKKNILSFSLTFSLVLFLTILFSLNKNFYNSLLANVIFSFIFARFLIHISELYHEAIHFNFIPNNKNLNDKIANIFLGLFIFRLDIKSARKIHFNHHSNSNEDYYTEKDHETYQFSPYKKFDKLLLDLIGVSILNSIFLIIFNLKIKKTILVILLIFYYSLLGSLIYFNYFLLAAIVFSYGSIYMMFSRIRIFLQHQDNSNEQLSSKNLKKSFLNYLFTSEYMFLHKDHHKFPYIDHIRLNEISDKKTQLTFFQALNVTKH